MLHDTQLPALANRCGVDLHCTLSASSLLRAVAGFALCLLGAWGCCTGQPLLPGSSELLLTTEAGRLCLQGACGSCTGQGLVAKLRRTCLEH